MIGFRHDDGGRTESGRKGSANDCVTRAIAIVTGASYDDVYNEVARLNAVRGDGKRTARNSVPKRVRSLACAAFGLERVVLPPGPRPTYTEAHRRYGNCLVTTTRHVCALVDGALRDTFDGRTYTFSPITRPGCDPGETHERKAMSVWVPAKKRGITYNFMRTAV